VSKDGGESQSFLRRQLEVLHLQLISITTQTLIKTLQFNASFDVITDIAGDIDLLHNQVDCMPRDPFTFTNFFIPLRMHVETKEKLANVVSRLKPDSK
jgi:hypothetical protein